MPRADAHSRAVRTRGSASSAAVVIGQHPAIGGSRGRERRPAGDEQTRGRKAFATAHLRVAMLTLDSASFTDGCRPYDGRWTPANRGLLRRDAALAAVGVQPRRAMFSSVRASQPRAPGSAGSAKQSGRVSAIARRLV